MAVLVGWTALRELLHVLEFGEDVDVVGQHKQLLELIQ